ncbi:HPr family phosphocarrier protein [Paenarthrobacter sp.]|uniref:HPr family phosphocarrier protein n=1 Tax=Paenarthrobacter sp. TaxID=1931993 RepID=UPI002810BA35|nr:HPr family phosphocarrier protein [Paenarthrobacter sp.]
MPVRKAIVTAAIGLHARPAAEFVRAVNETGLPVTISKAGNDAVDARSLLEVMSADFNRGCEVELAVAEEALPAGRTVTEAEDALGGLAELLAAQAAQTPKAPAAP